MVRLALTHLTKREQIRRCTETTAEANECIDWRRFLVSFAGLVGIGALSPKLREAGDGENELSVDFNLPGYLTSTGSYKPMVTAAMIEWAVRN